MKTLRRFTFTSAIAVFVACCALPLFAGDPPSRVARLNYMSGEVSMEPGGVDDWAPATINRPITTADRLWADKDSRAELHIGSAAIRMGSETSVTLTNLSDNVVQFELYQGTLNVQVARLSHDEIFEIDTPNTAFTLLKPGNYRFDVDSNGDSTLVTVWKGKGVATGEGSDVQVEARRQVRFTSGRTLAHQTFTAPAFDAFDNWCFGLDERRERAVSARYVSPDVIGYEDLDEYGRWRELPAYGAVWFPARVSIGWEPYRYGHWAWIEPWGWTWVDDAPWGFAPFHYGRWVIVGGSWGWVPGPVHVRPYYAPALVVWTGSGASIGWFPLGYGEPYIPAYRVSREYFRVVNVNNTRITNITYVTNNYYHVDNVRITNIHYVHENRVTIVDQKVIVDSRRIDRTVYVDRDHDNGWHNGRDRWVASCPPVPPSRHSVLGERADNDTRRPPDRILYRPVVMKRIPPERPVPFDDKRAEIEKHGGRPLDSGEENNLRKKPVEVAERDKDRGFRPDRDHDRQLSDDRKDRDDHKDRPGDDRKDRASDDRKDRGDRNDRSGDNHKDHGNDDRKDRADASRNSNGHDFPSRVPRPPRREDGDDRRGGQTDRGNGDSHQPGQNQGGNDNRRGNGNGNGHDDAGDLVRQRQGWAGERANGNPHTPDQSANDGHGNNGNKPQDNGNKPQGNGSNDATDLARARQPWAGERANRDKNSMGSNPSSMRQVPRPPQSNSNSVSQSSNSAMSGAPAERSFPRPSDVQRNNNRPPMQQSSPTGGVAGSRGDNQRHAPAEDRSAPRPSYGDRGAGPAPVQQAERSAPRMSPPSQSRPAMQQQHVSEAPHSSAPQSHSSGGGNSGGSRGGESHGNSGHDHGDSSDHDSKPKN